MDAMPSGELQLNVMKQPEGSVGWEPIEVTVPSTISSNTFVLTATESLTGKIIRVSVCGDDLKEAFEKTLDIYTGDAEPTT